MSLTKVFLLAGAAAFVSSAALAGGHVPIRASDVIAFHKATASHKQLAPVGTPKPPKCGTGFGTPPPTPDGIVAWNDTSGTTFDTGGAADFTCVKKTKVKQVWVKGYFGTAVEQFNVTFYGNSSTDGSDEPDDNNVVCSYTGLTGAAGGQYPTEVLTKLKLPTPCKLKGYNWVAVQNNDPAGPWYWEVQNETHGSTFPNFDCCKGPDWVDRHGVFTGSCPVFDNDLYLVDCLGYTYGDWMVELH